jgi:hypothetical protein
MLCASAVGGSDWRFAGGGSKERQLRQRVVVLVWPRVVMLVFLIFIN